MAKVLIHDGMTRRATFRGNSVWPDVSYRYRPALDDRIQVYNAAVRGGDGQTITKVLHQLVADQLQEWDIEAMEGGGTAKIDVQNVGRVPAPIIDHMLTSISGYRADEQVKDAKNSPTGSVSS